MLLILEIFCLSSNGVMAIFHLFFIVKGEASVQTGRCFSFKMFLWRNISYQNGCLNPQQDRGFLRSAAVPCNWVQLMFLLQMGHVGWSQRRDSDMAALLQGSVWMGHFITFVYKNKTFNPSRVFRTSCHETGSNHENTLEHTEVHCLPRC